MTGKRSEVLGTIKEWIVTGGGAQDILDDSSLYEAVISFLDAPSDHKVFQAENFGDNSVRQSWAGLMQQKESLRTIFLSHTMRPPISRAAPRTRSNSNGARKRHLNNREPPDLDRIDPEALVDNLDGMGCAAFSNVTEEVGVVVLSFNIITMLCVWKCSSPWCPG